MALFGQDKEGIADNVIYLHMDSICVFTYLLTTKKCKSHFILKTKKNRL